MKKQAFNPYLPSWEYIPDGEPYVFGDRVYIYGSHDFFNGYVFCPGDYMCYSAPIDDLGNWRCEGVIYGRCDDPINKDGKMCLYAPDVTVGPDGRYYLYYALDKRPIMSVAVSDTPAGRYEFYGYVHYEDGTRLGEREGDEPSFDPGVITDNGVTYLYSGFCGNGDLSRTGSRVMTLADDMLTIVSEPITIVPGCMYSAGTGFEGHAFFEASSIRKVNNKFYLIYSSEVMHELCYAVSDTPMGEFRYGGVIVSNCDIGIDSYKPADMPAAYGANNHGSIIEINGEWYIFYHRQTGGNWYSRQGCAEKIEINSDGSINQVTITSCGLNGGPLMGEGEYPAYLACNLFTDEPHMYVGDTNMPKIIQDGRDGDENPGYVANVVKNTYIGFKYFDCKGVTAIKVTTRGYASGIMEVRLAYDGEAVGSVNLEFSNVWETYETKVDIPDGIHAIYLVFKGDGNASVKSFELVR